MKIKRLFRHPGLRSCHPEFISGSHLVFNDKSGVSLIIAIIFVSAFMVILAGLTEAQIKTMRAINNRDMEEKAMYLAESAAELAAYYVGTSSVGANADSSAVSMQQYSLPLIEMAEEIGITDCAGDGAGATPCVGFEVRGRASDTQKVELNDTQYFSVPVKGTGDAAEDCVLSDDADDNANDPCHWNKLYVGQSVEIPLYYEDETGEPVRLDLTGMGDFKLRVRTPCETGASGPECSRVVLYPMPGTPNNRDIFKNPVLIQWLISDQGSENTLLAADKIKENNNRWYYTDEYITSNNTAITAVTINDARENDSLLNNYIVLQKQLGSFKYKGLNLVSKTFPFIDDFLLTTAKPILRLAAIRRIHKDNDGSALPDIEPTEVIPYLEYQLLTTSAVSDSRSYVRAWSQLGEFRREMEEYVRHPEALGGFAMESF